MRGLRVVAAVAVSAATLGACGGQSKSGSAAPRPTTTYKFVSSDQRTSDKALVSAERLMTARRLTQTWAKTTNTFFAPPRNIPVVGKKCGEVNAYYDPANHAISMCYEMTDHLTKLFTNENSTTSGVDDKVVGALDGIYYHELGHGLIDLYKLPSTGREEDAVDQLSAMVMIERAKTTGDYKNIESSIEAWGKMAETEEVGKDLFADEHALSIQRYYN